MGDGETRRKLGAAYFQRNYGNLPLPRLFERAHESIRVARSLHEQSHDARAGLLQRKIEVLVHRDRELLAGRHDQVEVDALVRVDDAAHAVGGMANVADVAAPRVLTCKKPAGPYAVREVVKTHAIGPGHHE